MTSQKLSNDFLNSLKASSLVTSSVLKALKAAVKLIFESPAAI
jgi:hypothetical protein